jgi:hypothetical protein
MRSRHMKGYGRVACVTASLVMAGCTSADTVMMQHPTTNEIARCAEGHRRFIAGEGYKTQEDCIADYERQGFVRVPATRK